MTGVPPEASREQDNQRRFVCFAFPRLAAHKSGDVTIAFANISSSLEQY